MPLDPRLARARAAAQTTTPPPPPPEKSPPSGQAINGHDHAQQETSWKLKFCTVCASNNNRSMEGHIRLAEAKYPVISFGTGSLVRLPGPSINQPNVYNFNSVSYDQMYRELESKDPRLYRTNGILNMLERNRSIKSGPERWQDWRIGEPRLGHSQDQGALGSEGGFVDVVITCEERCWDAVVDDILSRGSSMNRPVHVFNVDIKDSHEEALVGGKAIVDLADALNKAANGPTRQAFDDSVPDILSEWQERWPQFPSQWTLAWF